MTVSQDIYKLKEDPTQTTYDDTITVDGIADKHIVAITSITAEAPTRQITITVMSADFDTPSQQSVSTGIYKRLDGETAVKVTVEQDGAEQASNTTDYS